MDKYKVRALLEKIYFLSGFINEEVNVKFCIMSNIEQIQNEMMTTDTVHHQPIGSDHVETHTVVNKWEYI